ncbi:MAG: hypothetical protein C0392_15990, partial [Syntrophus sp. (in: bacteria)]|nr:hypothetical protein [Syntrophus sp. (in: bacteria)]
MPFFVASFLFIGLAHGLNFRHTAKNISDVFSFALPKTFFKVLGINWRFPEFLAKVLNGQIIVVHQQHHPFLSFQGRDLPKAHPFATWTLANELLIVRPSLVQLFIREIIR